MKKIKSLSIFSVAVLVGLTSSSAFAGFEWRPPQDIVPSEKTDTGSVMLDEQAAVIDTQTAVKVDRTPLPVAVEETLPAPKPAPQMATPRQEPNEYKPPLEQKMAPMPTQMEQAAPAPAMMNSAPVSLTAQDFSMPQMKQDIEINPTVATEQGVSQIVDGFGKQVPLLVAVRQIVPVDYEFYFNKDIQVNTFVSWQGGRSWQRVLTDALAPSGLTFTLVNDKDVVAIYKTGTESDLLSSDAYQLARNKVIAPQGNTELPVTTAKAEKEMLSQDAKDVSEVVAKLPQGEDVELLNDAQREMEKAKVDAKTPAKVSLPTVAFQKPTKPEKKVWYGGKGETLRSTLMTWAQKADVDLYWDCEFDYPLQATFVAEGTFETAVQKILEGFDQAQPRPLGRLHRNGQDDHAVLVVEANGLIR